MQSDEFDLRELQDCYWDHDGSRYYYDMTGERIYDCEGGNGHQGCYLDWKGEEYHYDESGRYIEGCNYQNDLSSKQSVVALSFFLTILGLSIIVQGIILLLANEK